MIGAYASLLIILLVSAAIGQALISLSLGVRRGAPVGFSYLAPPVGLGAMLVLAGIAARFPGHAVTALVVLAAATALALWWLRGRLKGVGETLALAAPVVVISTAIASLPFALAGHVGILGAGLVNDDMASHLLIAEYVRDPSGFEPSFIRGGYPTGPHALVVAISEALGGAGLVDVFAGFTLALAPLAGIVALGLLGGLSTGRRVLGACLVSLSYLGASYLASGAFKEPLQALILIAFAVLLAQVIGIRTAADGPRRDLSRVPPILRVLPLAVLAAASVFNYSLPGLLWIAAVGLLVLAARLWVVRPRPRLPADWRRRFAPYLVGGVLVLALATVQEWSRIADFARLEALNPDRFGSDLGNLKGAISPLEALGIWPTGDYRTSAEAAGPPAIAFFVGAAVAAAGLIVGLYDARRRALYALPAALLAIAGVWVLTWAASTPYIAAKALAIAAPVAMLIAVRGLLAARGLLAISLTAVFIAAAGLSSFLALRQASVGPSSHADELAEIRDVVQGEKVLFLGRDDFIAWELAGSDEITGIVTNYYSVADARARFQKGEGGGEKFDVDAVFPKTMDQFPYVLATRGGPVSEPPPRLVPVVETDNYVLYERRGLVGRRKTLDEGAAPGAILDCETPEGQRVATGKGTAVYWPVQPVVGDAADWEPNAEPTDEQASTQTLELGAGRWLLSLAYDSRRPLRVSAPAVGLDETMVANLDFRGPTPFFPIGEVELDGDQAVEVKVEVQRPNWLARVLGAPNEAHLRALSATPVDVTERVQRRTLCGEYVDWYRAR